MHRGSKHSGIALKASATVETTMIMPLVLLVIFFLISVGFYEHDKAVFSEQSFLTSRSISMYGEDGDMKDKLMAMCLAAKGIDINSEENMIRTSTVSEGTVRMIMFGKALKLMSEEHYVKCYAPDLIRTIRVGENIKDSIIERK